MISVQHLTKTYYNADGSSLTVLKDINCDIQKGEVISIIGPSGTGKSTLLRSLNLLEKPESGHVKVDGKEYEGSYSFIFISNSSRIAGQPDIYYDIKLDDNLFEVA